MTLVSISTVNLILSALTVIGQMIIGLVIISLIIRRKKIISLLSKNALLFSFGIALIATLGSLFYSEIAGYEPCKLCWYQRIFIYPQVILLGMALWNKDRDILHYALPMSIIGAVIAGYQYLLQIGVASGLPCDAVGYSVSCSPRFVMNFGYITIPLMALTAFSLIVLFSIISSSRH